MTELRPAKIFMQPFLPGDAWLLHCAHNGSWSHFPEGSAPRILKLQRFMVWGQKILFKVLTLKYICMNMDQKPMQRALVWSGAMLPAGLDHWEAFKGYRKREKRGGRGDRLLVLCGAGIGNDSVSRLWPHVSSRCSIHLPACGRRGLSGLFLRPRCFISHIGSSNSAHSLAKPL